MSIDEFTNYPSHHGWHVRRDPTRNASFVPCLNIISRMLRMGINPPPAWNFPEPPVWDGLVCDKLEKFPIVNRLVGTTQCPRR